MSTVITFDLSRGGVARAARELDKFIANFNRNVADFMNRAGALGVQIATVTISAYGAVDTGELADSISCTEYDPSAHCVVVYSKAPYAIYVEYGTGMVGAALPHPDIGGFPPPLSEYTGYDTNGHGEAGWTYVSDRDGKLHWTKGMISRPFMYHAYREVDRQLVKIAQEVFGR